MRLGRLLGLAVVFLAAACAGSAGGVFHAQGEMAGEVTQTSVILQSRLTASDALVDGDVPGAAGLGFFEVSRYPDFTDSFTTPPLTAEPSTDYVIKTCVKGLTPATRYYYRFIYDPDVSGMKTGPACTFRTLAPPDVEEPVSFCVVTGMNYSKFHRGSDYSGMRAYTGPDKHLGYPGLISILKTCPDFFVGTGDNVYYDQPSDTRATTQDQLRKKWHEQFVQPRYRMLFSRVPTYWEKDDHDHRYNDCDNTTGQAPSSQLGIDTFIEQVPVVDPADPGAVTYRTHRINKLLQIWLVEGRDYRSPNSMKDGPDKTIWGEEQRNWLKRTLLESDAVFKILISPTPMVGPDDGYKSDNHTNPKGFRHEGDQFFGWLGDNGFLEQNFYIICGDRHWQYHSVHPSGFEEFSTGALVDANSRIGRSPGDPDSTDPDGKVKQIYTQTEASGGFLHVVVEPGGADAASRIVFTFYDEHGEELYRCSKTVSQPRP